MLKRHLSIALGALLAVAIATGVSAAEDNPERCGGYYACIELQPAQPSHGTSASPYRFGLM
jgi:hypothetical protein